MTQLGDLSPRQMVVLREVMRRAKKREQGWGTINAAISIIGAWLLVRYGFHDAPNTIVISAAIGGIGVVDAWRYRQKGGFPTDAKEAK